MHAISASSPTPGAISNIVHALRVDATTADGMGALVGMIMVFKNILYAMGIKYRMPYLAYLRLNAATIRTNCRIGGNV